MSFHPMLAWFVGVGDCILVDGRFSEVTAQKSHTNKKGQGVGVTLVTSRGTLVLRWREEVVVALP